MASFDSLGLSQKGLAAVADLGYSEPTPIQEQSIPLVLQGSDVIAAAKTGTGKTAAFSLPCMDALGHAKGKQGPFMLVITPTRELAQQIGAVCETIARHTKHRILTVVGGLSYDPQINALKRGVDVLIATPGRLIDLMDQKAVRLGDVQRLVLDEADRMLDMGFLPAVKRIVNATPETRQTLLFSATIDSSIMETVGTMLRDPEIVEIAHKGETADTIEQYIVKVPQTLKTDLLECLLKERGHKRVIVFVRTRRRVDNVCRKIKRMGYAAETIHSDRSQNQRKRALVRFANGEADILVATDVLARGIDVAEVSYVVNFDIPTQPEDYVHRIGRTGRAGATGYAVSFVTPETEKELRDIQKLIKREIPELEVQCFDQEAATAAAVERANRIAAKKDPDIAEAVKEIKKKERKKEKARQAAVEEQQAAASEKKPKKARGKISANATLKMKSSSKQAKPQGKGAKSARKAETEAAPKGSIKGARKARASAPSKTAAKNAPKANVQKPAKNSAKSSSKGAGKSQKASSARKAAQHAQAAPVKDFRPGRAQRAARALQRGKGN